VLRQEYRLEIERIYHHPTSSKILSIIRRCKMSVTGR
jgi:hypothetical protein